MATIRWLYKRRKLILLILCASTFWIAYLYLSLPSHKGKHHQKLAKEYINYNGIENGILSQTRKFNSITARVNTLNKYGHLVLLPPPGEDRSRLHSTNRTKNETTKDGIFKHWINISHVGSHIRNKTWEIGTKVKSKTYQVAETMKNKTMDQLAVFGVGKKWISSRFIFVPHRWNLTLSFADIGNIMKDTEFLSKLQPLDMKSPVLASTKNRTANYTYNMSFHVGFCDCYEHYCVCCARIAHKRLHLNTTACTNFTFISKSQDIALQVLLDSKPIYKNVITAKADETPMVCLGTYPQVVDICIHFFNMTFKVNLQHDHKTQLLGCTDFSLNLYNKTIGSFPVDCFQIPGDPNHKHNLGLNMFNVPNWMP